VNQAAELALWLLPADPGIQGVIDRLAARHATHPFAAHVTVLSGLTPPDAATACAALAELALHCAPIALEIAGAGESDEYFETAFLRCVENEALRTLRDRAQRVLGPGRAPAIGPHVSLVYAELPRATRRAIADAHAQAIAGPLRCARLALVQPGPLGWRRVEQWCVLCGCDLQA
jgi:hypothetical protein